MRREITKRYNYLSSEINSLYHQAAKKMGISDSVQNILYVLCDQGNQARRARSAASPASAGRPSIPP